jgi:hypothetical protein
LRGVPILYSRVFAGRARWVHRPHTSAFNLDGCRCSLLLLLC